MGGGHWSTALLVAQITLTVDIGRSKVDFKPFWSHLGAIWESFCNKSVDGANDALDDATVNVDAIDIDIDTVSIDVDQEWF